MISHIEEAKDLVERKIKELKRRSKNLPSENPFDFTQFVQMQKEENDIDLGLFFELAEQNKIIYNQVPVNTLMDDMEKLKNGFIANGFFTLADDGETETKRFFRASIDLAKFIDKILRPSFYILYKQYL